MNRERYIFPKDFKWGTATAAYQVEGHAANNDWVEYEKAGKIQNNGSAAIACDWWEGERWREDFDRAAEGGQTAHRMSVEWSRIEPQPGIWDEEALDHYRQMVKGLRERGIEPMVTLHHFTNPLWLVERGGWENPDVVKYFERYVNKVVDALKGHVDMWCTINEMNVFAYRTYIDKLAPLTGCLKMIRHMLMAHSVAYREIHRIQPEAKVGIAHHIQLIDPYRPDFTLDRWVASFQSHIFNYSIPHALHTGLLHFPIGRWNEYIPWLANTLDFMGVNYYSRQVSAFDISSPGTFFGRVFHSPEAETDNVKINSLYPQGISRVIKWASKFNKPIYITENGWGDVDESRRTRAMLLHLNELHGAAKNNLQLKGYYYWTLVDNFEWDRGWGHPFGLYALDRATQKRTPRDVAKLYAEVCRTNTINPELVSRYAPEILPTMFPG